MASAQRICVLSKLVHASERQWCRLVIPGAMLKLWTAMQKELQAQGSDFQIYVTDPTCTHTWCWGVRIMVQRPMLLELAAFYADMGVQEGDAVQLYRDIQTNQLVVDVVRRAGAAARAVSQPTASGSTSTTTAGGSGHGGSAAALQRAASCASDYAAAAAAALTARRLPGQVWTAHAHKATKQPAAASEGVSSGPTHIRRKSPAQSEDDGGDDEDWSPTVRGAGRGGRGGGGPLPVRRKLEAPLPPKAHLWAALASTDSNSDDESSDVVYTAEQMRRFDALVEAAERLAPAALGAADYGM